MKPIIKSPLNEKLDIKYKLIVTKVDQYRGDVRVDIKFNSNQDYLIAKQKFNRNAIIRLFTGLKTPDNHVFVRKFGYFDLSTTITIIINGPVIEDETFLTEVEQIAKLAIKKQLAQATPTQNDYKQNVENIKQPYTPRESKQPTQKPIVQKSLPIHEQKIHISDYPKALKLFNTTIAALRRSYKQLNDDELWAFGVQMAKFFNGYKE